MLLTSLSIALIACIFGFKQSRQLKQAQDSLNKQGLELEILRSQYKHNLKRLSQYQCDSEYVEKQIVLLNLEIEAKNSKILNLDNQVKDLELDIKRYIDSTLINEDNFQEALQAHILNILASIDLHDAYERACYSYDLELDIEDLIK